jgi:hypothetical protein
VALWTAFATVALSVFLYCPRFENWTRGYPYSWETYRGAGFLMQCAAPLRSDVEPALQWRLLLPAICHGLHLGPAALLVPWLGVIALCSVVTVRLVALGLSRIEAVLATLLIGTTSAAITCLGMLGVNDCWVWAGLCAVALGASKPWFAACCLLCPWIDERFIVGLPLAAVMRSILATPPGAVRTSDAVRGICIALLWCLPYAALRLILTVATGHGAAGQFGNTVWVQAYTWVYYIPTGWWHGLRFGWFLVMGLMLASTRALDWKVNLLIWLTLWGTICIMGLLASDLSRSAAICIPAMLAGLILLKRVVPRQADVWLWLVLALNVALPAAHYGGAGEGFQLRTFVSQFGWR